MHTTVVWTTINMISSQKLRVPIPMQQGAYQEVAGVSSLNSESGTMQITKSSSFLVLANFKGKKPVKY